MNVKDADYFAMSRKPRAMISKYQLNVEKTHLAKAQFMN